MAPMTRLRAIDNIPNSLMATYYAQRASAGLHGAFGYLIDQFLQDGSNQRTLGVRSVLDLTANRYSNL